MVSCLFVMEKYGDGYNGNGSYQNAHAVCGRNVRIKSVCESPSRASGKWDSNGLNFWIGHRFCMVPRMVGIERVKSW